MNNSKMTLKEKAYTAIHEMIMSGELKPGDVLTERMLVELLGMSRTPIRAALERLDANGLAKYTPNKGLVVTEMSLKKVIDLYDFRMAVECFVVKKLCSIVWREDDIRWFEENLKQQERSMADQNFEQFTQADSQFHRMLAEVLGNAEISGSIEQLQDKLYLTALRVLRKDHARIAVSYEDHVQIFHAIRSGNAQHAVQSMERHLEYGKQILIM